MGKWGRKRTVVASCWMMGIASMLFGASSYFKVDWMFYVSSATARAIQGFGDGLIEIAVPAILAIEFPDNTEFYIGLAFMTMGVGLMLGPLFGAFLFHTLDSYANTFYVLGAVILVVCTMSSCLIPSRVNNYEEPSVRQTIVQKVPLTRYFVNAKGLTTIAVMIIGPMGMIFLDPILAVNLRK